MKIKIEFEGTTRICSKIMSTVDKIIVEEQNLRETRKLLREVVYE